MFNNCCLSRLIFSRRTNEGGTQNDQLRRSNEQKTSNRHPGLINRQEHGNFPLTNLPIEILLIIKEYLTPRDYSQILNASKHPQIRALKSYSIAYNLPSKESWKYYNNENRFQDLISAALYSKRRQLSLTLGELRGVVTPTIDFSKPVSLSVLCNLKQLTLRNVTVDMELLGKVENLSRLWLEGFTSVTVLPNLNHRNIEAIVIKSFPLLTDVSTIAAIPSISIIFCSKLEDVSPLSSCRDLTLQSCISIRDISMLGNHQQLTLAYCPNISSIENLNTVKQLTLRECDNIRNLSSLGEVSELTIRLRYLDRLPAVSRTKKLTFHTRVFTERNYSNETIFAELEELDLYLYGAGSSTLKSLPIFIEDSMQRMSIHRYDGTRLQPFTFSHVYVLEIVDAWNLTDVSMLGHIPVLHLISLYHLTATTGLGKPTQKEVVIEGCKLADVRDLRDVKRVEIRHCYRQFSIDDLQYCQEILIIGCDQVTSLTKSLLNCRRFMITNCPRFDSLSGLEDVDCLEVRNCGIKGDVIQRKKRDY